MQCPSCQFENMPGIDVCGRCGANLRAQALAIPVHPPRASVRVKTLRTLFGWLPRWESRFTDAARRLTCSTVGRWDVDVPEYQVLWRMIVPGWPQLYCGRTLRGRIFLGVWLALLLPGLVLIGSGVGSVLIGLAISCHASSVMDIALLGMRTLHERFVRCLLAFFGVVFLIYVPAGWLLSHVAAPRVIQVSGPPLERGDVLIVNSLRGPRVGDVVVYDIARTQVAGRTPIGFAANYIIQGERTDRILAAPGQEVIILEGTLLVDGVPSETLPLNPHSLPEGMTFTVGPQQWLIIPSTDPWLAARPEAIPGIALVHHRAVLGTVMFRSRPLSRFGPI